MLKRLGSSVIGRNSRGLASFTLVELLTVIAIIAILAALTLGAASGVMQHAKRSRTASELEAMKNSLDSYKIDNGAYPVGSLTPAGGSSLLGPPPAQGSYPLNPAINNGNYQIASEGLFQALAGRAYFTLAPTAGVKSYITLRADQVGNLTGPNSYIKDPWSYAYGYSTGDANNPQQQYPNNGTGSYDIWSTAGTTNNSTTLIDATKAWIDNWH